MQASNCYAELATATNFSFLRGASHPEELVAQALALGLSGIGIADRNSLAGVVRAHVFAREHDVVAKGLRVVTGVRLVFDGAAPDILAYPRDRTAYGRLCRLLTRGNMRAKKGRCLLYFEDLWDFHEGLQFIIMDNHPDDVADHRAAIERLHVLARGRVWLAAAMTYATHMRERLARRINLSQELNLPLIAVNDVIMHHPDRRPLADAVACIREHATVNTAGARFLAANAERHLKPPAEMARLFADAPQAIAETMRFLAGISFSLDELRYDYPDELREGFASEQEALEHYAFEGAKSRYPQGVPAKVEAAIRYELALVAELKYAAYFLTVHDIVRFARSRGILCQGRGSAANSSVCFCLGITEVDPSKHDLLFERFISAERKEPPDIDVDFEHERREEVIQYIYQRFGRHRAGLTATVISYRARSAIRETAKVFGIDPATIAALSGSVWGWRSAGVEEKEAMRMGVDTSAPTLQQAMRMAEEISGFPRHLSQHTGGFVITKTRLDEVVPIAPAAMEGRTTVEWDKDDLDALGILKIDILALGMLSALRRSFEFLTRHYGQSLTLATIPAEEACVYEMISRADTIGVFQIESRAQMSMLPRLKPKEFYDLVIEVAIVRPGPIQGDMVHPYLRRRQGIEKIAYPSQELEAVLGKTMGVPLFQEQAMKIAIVAAGFTPSEADKLRRAMATFKRVGTLHTFHDKMISGMVAKGYDADFATRCFKQIEGFGSYGFPESHAAS
ncbi:MAG: error-prone DNA polymerase, partial [Beijerinckiaceae bacterium]